MSIHWNEGYQEPLRWEVYAGSSFQCASRSGVRIRISAIAVFLVIISVTACSNGSPTKQDRMAIEMACEDLSSKMGGVSAYWVGQCVETNIEQYKNGEPSFATHSEQEVLKFMRDQAEPEIERRREDDPELVEHINNKCVQAAALVLGINGMRREGTTESEAVDLLQSIEEEMKNASIGELIVHGIVLSAVEDLYHRPENVMRIADDASSRCVEQYEMVMGFR